MPRLEKERHIDNPPPVSGFKPIGKPRSNLRETILTLDEYEAIRLSDGEDMTHEEAAKKMRISRPTFSRLIKKARKKIADTLTHGLFLKIEGGTVCFRKDMKFCLDCGNRFCGDSDTCPICGSRNITSRCPKNMK